MAIAKGEVIGKRGSTRADGDDAFCSVSSWRTYALVIALLPSVLSEVL